jgi:hypothetical protein
MIDEKGRIGGKVNLVDLVIVLILVAAVVFVAVKFFGPESTAANTEKVIISFYNDDCPTYVAEALNEGDVVWDSSSNVTVGTVKDWTSVPATAYILDANSDPIAIPADGYCYLTLNCEAEGVIGEHGVTIGGTLYGVGHTLTLYAGESKMYLKVSAIAPAQG